MWRHRNNMAIRAKKIVCVVLSAMVLLLLPAGRALADFIVADATFTLANNDELATSTITINPDGVLNGGDGKITVSGDWANAGLFNAGTSTVAFENSAATSAITGNTTFYSLASAAAGKTINFAAGSTQTVTNKFSVAGAFGNRVKLRSSVPGNKWYISFPNGPQAVSYADVKDSDALYNSVMSRGSLDSGNNNAAWVWLVPLAVAPEDGAVGVSQSPALSAVDLTLGTSVQYQFQVDTLAGMNSQGGSPLFDFDQSAAQLFAGAGAFSGQDSTVTVTGDAYSSVSTATFAFYSNSAKLSPDTPYYWRARAKPAGEGYGDWSATASFTTGRFAAQSPVNHLAISGGSLSGAAGAVSIGFTIAENNVTTGTSAGGGAYNTADWIFVKYSTAAGADGTWSHATLTGGSVGAGATLTAASDNKGVFLNHTANSAYWTAGATVTWNSAADGVFSASVVVKVFAISMVRVPAGSFVYMAGGSSNTNYNTPANYNGGLQATITGPGTAVGTGTNNLPSGAPVGWPNGYNGFYIGRYEITQGQYADFLNTVGASTATARHEVATDYGHNITNTGAYPNKYAAVDRNAAKNYLSVVDAWSYMSWAGLRPPTEMEWEKAGRDISDTVTDARTYPWGNTEPGTATYTPPNEGGTYTRNYLNYNYVTGGYKVLDVGRYMSGDVSRTAAETGASPWGIADLAGNVWEYMLNCAYTSIPLNGTGTVVWPAGWPTPGVAGYGRRGGSWDSPVAREHISDRLPSGWAQTGRDYSLGARVARTP